MHQHWIRQVLYKLLGGQFLLRVVHCCTLSLCYISYGWAINYASCCILFLSVFLSFNMKHYIVALTKGFYLNCPSLEACIPCSRSTPSALRQVWLQAGNTSNTGCGMRYLSNCLIMMGGTWSCSPTHLLQDIHSSWGTWLTGYLSLDSQLTDLWVFPILSSIERSLKEHSRFPLVLRVWCGT